MQSDAIEEMWRESVRKDGERRRRENRWEWVRHFDRMAASHARLAQSFEERALELLEDDQPKGASR